ncbi:MAG: hypothetical protein WC637_22115 [Victivallales bacterium]|jgi:hypothetical protein
MERTCDVSHCYKQENAMMKKPRWSPVLTFYVFLSLAAIISLFIFLLMKKSLYVELEIITGLVSFLIFLFLSVMLYHGVAFNKNEKITISWADPNLNEFSPADIAIYSGGMFTMAGAEAGLIGFLLGILLDFIISSLLVIALAALLWIGINTAIATFAIIMIPLFFLYEKSLRIIVVKGRRCRADFAKTLLYSFGITALYTGWFYAILFAAHLLSKIGG